MSNRESWQAGVVAVSVIGLLGAVPVAASAKQKAPATQTLAVHGGFINDGQCEFTSMDVADAPNSVSFTCVAGALWSGDLTGHTTTDLSGTIDSAGNWSGTYDDYFIGEYVPDGRSGGLHYHGTFSIDGATLVFHADGSIVSSSCGMAGSSGSSVYDGDGEWGGWAGTWTRPVIAPSPPTTCQPEVAPVTVQPPAPVPGS